ncbi:L-2-hydroxyglutarate oxidase [Sporolactobacillus sp. CQH2019]|uniref:L-2-hydroxyglutarate oxidase n=1 Tax=Sporolactobacillus sp. CQH2019 TaxID=3023512 RepID=UPI002368A797|nr:L-2-hydroxyglutarate oxidase [Sporolactobacillus sp. CQH2019]MDD9148698.1 L-2-hydroxyglutarate oxidase [Sporolactobacillus sp. CQH2019]
MLDYLIVGGGIVGLSTAYALGTSNPHARIAVLEKEKTVAYHQTGHNSGVIHSGIYYRPGSLKARFAREGGAKLRALCDARDIPYENCGKVIVAVAPEELPLLDGLYRRGLENRLDLAWLNPEQLHEIEPHARGLKAIHVKSTGIVDYKQVANGLADIISQRGGEIHLNHEVLGIHENKDGVTVECARDSFSSRFLVNCAGLYCDRLAIKEGARPEMRIVPFRGEYYELKPEKRYLVKNLIYPVPNPKFPFLGVHFTRMIDGRVLAGPNAVLGFRREGYRKRDFKLGEFLNAVSYPALWKIAAKNMSYGIGEMARSLSKKRFVAGMKLMIPQIGEEDVFRAQAGVRAQALTRDGVLADDFMMIRHRHALHVLNAPSPAATASLSIGEAICRKVTESAQFV